jgi:hypothetical protein
MRRPSARAAMALIVAIAINSEGQLINKSFGQPLVGKPPNSAAPRLGGTFIQLLEEHGSWSSSRWDELFQNFHSVGIDELIVQWSVLNGTAIYPSHTFRSIPNAPLENILARADAAGMRVLIGLAHDSDYWAEVQRDPHAVAVYLRKLRAKSDSAARELAPAVTQHSSFAGWYISEEVDDVNWRKTEARTVLFDHLTVLARELKKLTPKAVISISAFSQAKASPQAYQQFWDEFFQRVQVNAVLFQDGLGVNKLDLHDVPLYLQALRDAADKNGRTVQCVVELFSQVAGPPIDKSEFRAVPAPIARIREQLETAAKYSTGQIVGFSVPEYMTPGGGDAAGELLAQYLAIVGTVNSGSRTPDKQERKQQ